MAEHTASDWLNRKRASAFLASLGCPISVRTLEQWAANNNRGKGPPFNRVRTKIIRYLKDDLRDWAAKETRRIA